jgi:hypothetical protein
LDGVCSADQVFLNDLLLAVVGDVELRQLLLESLQLRLGQVLRLLIVVGDRPEGELWLHGWRWVAHYGPLGELDLLPVLPKAEESIVQLRCLLLSLHLEVSALLVTVTLHPLEEDVVDGVEEDDE